MRLIVNFLLSTLFTIVGVADINETVLPESVGLSSQRLSNIDKLIDKHIEEKKIAGSVVIVARKCQHKINDTKDGLKIA